jgi:hypothetical protein
VREFLLRPPFQVVEDDPLVDEFRAYTGKTVQFGFRDKISASSLPHALSVNAAAVKRDAYFWHATAKIA